MEITRQADYAIRAILFLAENEKKGRAPTNLIAEAKHIPPSFLAKIISQLSVAGLVLEVIDAIDGPISINECALDLSVCEFGKECLVGPVWCRLQEELVSRLKEVTFRQLVKEPEETDSAPPSV
jgi:DNA-binding IscR family transcriptional regulator